MIPSTILVVLSGFLLGAHFYRHMNLPAAVLSTAAPLLLLVRRRWSLIVLQSLACAGALVWILTMLEIVQARQMAGRRWIGVVLILGSVSLVTILSGLLLNSPRVRSRYPK